MWLSELLYHAAISNCNRTGLIKVYSIEKWMGLRNTTAASSCMSGLINGQNIVESLHGSCSSKGQNTWVRHLSHVGLYHAAISNCSTMGPVTNVYSKLLRNWRVSSSHISPSHHTVHNSLEKLNPRPCSILQTPIYICG